MNQPTVTHFFLGANSKDGFYSLYDYFASGENDTLHIIKSGPGTGKSTFMKQIGKAAEENNLDVEYILCSGDPDSLDGVYIPALHTGWVDGTSPHILEPKHFGIDGDYIDLGQFCDTSLLRSHENTIKTLTSAYKLCYQKAYIYINAAGTIMNSTAEITKETHLRIYKRALAKINKELNGTTNSPLKPTMRFIRAISCKGNFLLTNTLETHCDRLCILESHHKLEQIFFNAIIAQIKALQVYAIICPSPLDPEETEAIIFPEQKLCFITSQATANFTGKSRTIHLDAYLDDDIKSEYKQREKLQQQLLDAAYTHLAKAKYYHDELETYYRPALDIAALTQYTDDQIKRLFG